MVDQVAEFCLWMSGISFIAFVAIIAAKWIIPGPKAINEKLNSVAFALTSTADTESIAKLFESFSKFIDSFSKSNPAIAALAGSIIFAGIAAYVSKPLTPAPAETNQQSGTVCAPKPLDK